MVRERFSAVAILVEIGAEMKIQIDTESLNENRWYEYVERFIFGGLITAITGVIAHKFGPETAGLFLAFPAIFPATATLVAKHEHENKQNADKPGARSGRAVASVDAAGTAMGTLGLIGFALFVWKVLPNHATTFVLIVATIIWLAISIGAWLFRKLAMPAIRRYRHRTASAEIPSYPR